MSLLDRFRRWTPLLSFEMVLGEKNEIGVKTTSLQPNLDELELVRFWAFAAARILYEIWFTNTPQAFLVINSMARILEHDLEPATDCLKRAELYQFRYSPRWPEPVERVSGEYLGRDQERKLRFLTKLAFEGGMPSPLVMVSGVALLQYVLEKVKADPGSLQILSQTARMLITQFGIEEWAGKASIDKLPQAALAHAIHLDTKS